MSVRQRALFSLLLLIAVAVGLFLLFPVALTFLETAARSIKYLWWLILLIGLGVWLIWSGSRKS